LVRILLLKSILLAVLAFNISCASTSPEVRFVNEKPSATVAEVTLQNNFTESEGQIVDTNPSSTRNSLLIIQALPGDNISDTKQLDEVVSISSKTSGSKGWMFVILSLLVVASLISIMIIRLVTIRRLEAELESNRREVTGSED